MLKVRQDHLISLLKLTSQLSGYGFVEPTDLIAFGLSSEDMQEFIKINELTFPYALEKELPDGMLLPVDDKSDGIEHQILILLSEDYNVMKSVLVHELTHYLQIKNGHSYDDDIVKYELEAYNAQLAYCIHKGYVFEIPDIRMN